MKIIYFAIGFFSLAVFHSAFSATCTTTSRTNYSSYQVLSSSAVNADLNQIVTKLNAFDGGCVTDNTLELSSMNTTQFSSMLNGVHQGCSVDYSDTNTISVGKCIATVNGYNIKTATSNTVTWLCSGCSSESASTFYYVYIKTGSTGTTLNLLISTTAPGAEGYDVDGNKVVGKFFNNSTSAIEQNSVESWSSNRYLSTKEFSFTVSYYGASATTKCSGVATACVVKNNSGMVVSITSNSTGVYGMELSRAATSMSCVGSAMESTTTPAHFSFYYQPGPITSFEFATFTSTTAYPVAATFGNIHCTGYY